MWVRSTGKLSDHVWQLTTPVSTHFLLRAEKSALIDTGILSFAEYLLEQLKANLEPNKALDYVLLTHCQFDTLGGLALIREAFPEVTVFASPHAGELLAKADFLKDCFAKNESIGVALQRPVEADEATWTKTTLVSQVLRDGDALDLGDGVDVKVLQCLGHSDHSLGYFIRPDGAVYGGEAFGGYHGRGKYSSCFTRSFDEYVASLQKLGNLEINIVGFPHSGVVTGELAKSYVFHAQEEATRLYSNIKQRLESGEIVDEIHQTILPELKEQGLVADGPFQELVEESLRKMIQVVAAGN